VNVCCAISHERVIDQFLFGEDVISYTSYSFLDTLQNRALRQLSLIIIDAALKHVHMKIHKVIKKSGA
jgi:hypothetical protein